MTSEISETLKCKRHSLQLFIKTSFINNLRFRSLNFLGSVGEAKQETASSIIYSFLSKTVTVKVISIKMIRTYYRINRLAKYCKQNYSRNREKKKELNYIWETELANLMIKYRNSELEDDNKKEELLLNITDQQKSEAIADYLDR